MSTISITIAGNLTHNPELRFTPSGKAVLDLRVAVNDAGRTDEGEWVDRDAEFYTVQVWNAEAEHLAQSVTKGDEVIVTGALQVRCWTDREGAARFQKRIRTLGPVGISTRRATAQITKAQRTGGQEVPLPEEPAEQF